MPKAFLHSLQMMLTTFTRWNWFPDVFQVSIALLACCLFQASKWCTEPRNQRFIMIFGIVHETGLNEKRVCLTPQAARSLVEQGHQVYLETSAGDASGFTDQHYIKEGVQVVFNREELFGRADTLLKIRPLSLEDIGMLRDGQTVMAFHHLSVTTREIFKSLLDKKINTIGMEIMEADNGHRPVLTIMSELAGQMAPIISGNYLGRDPMGKGLALGSVPGVAPASVVIVGGGTVGISAARAFLGLGAQVHILDNNIEQLRHVRSEFGDRVTTLFANESNLSKMLQFADVLVAAVLVHGQLTPQLFSREMIATMKPRSIFIDYSVDEGGTSETTRPTIHSDPVYIDEGVIHYCVPNVTSGVNRTASIALSNVLSDYLSVLAELGPDEAIKQNSVLSRGLYTSQGKSRQPLLDKRYGVK